MNPSAPEPAAADLGTLREALTRLFAPWVQDLNLELLQAQAGEVTLRLGRNLVFGEVEVLNARGELAAHATSTCALL